MSDLVEQIDALLALNSKGAVSHPVPGLAVELLDRAKTELQASRRHPLSSVVKGLVWSMEFGYAARAASAIGTYAVTEYAGMSEPFKLEGAGQSAAYFVTLDQAKAAAQADYEQRILSALTTPKPEGEAVTPDFYAVWSGTMHIGTWSDERHALQAQKEVEGATIVPLYTNPLPQPLQPDVVTITDEMVLAGCRVLSPALFTHGLEALPGDGPATQRTISEDVKSVRNILTAALTEHRGQ